MDPRWSSVVIKYIFTRVVTSNGIVECVVEFVKNNESYRKDKIDKFSDTIEINQIAIYIAIFSVMK